MMPQLQLSNRYGYDGWALKHRDAPDPLHWSFCTTRKKCRELLREKRAAMPDLFDRFEPVKVKLTVEVV